jgi:superfamily II DNA or RNA helicase
MLRIIGGKIKWSERDLVTMTSIIGADAAVEMKCPMSASVLKLADYYGLLLSKTARKKLDAHIALRKQAKQLKKIKDTKPKHRLERKCFKHQRVDLRFMREMNLPSYLNASKTGVGKTLVALLWAHLIVKSERTLIITKNIAKDQWKDAIKYWIGKDERITIIEGKIPQQIKRAQRDRAWTIGHWESLAHAGEGYRAKDWDCIILDEGQYMYNRKTFRAELAFKLKTDHRMVATAHPFDKDPAQMFSLLKFMYPSMYRSYWRFFHMHVRATPKAFGGFEIEGARRPKLLAWEIAPFTVLHTKKEVFPNLPEIARVRRTVRLTPRGQREYDRLKKAFFAELDAIGGGTKYVPIINDLVRLTRVRQYLIDPALVGGREPSVKYPAILDELDEINAPAVIFTSFQKAGRRLGDYLTRKKIRVDFIDGKVKRKHRTRAKKRFLRGDLGALIIVRESGDTALNLGRYGYVLDLDLPFTQKGVEQEEGRVDRPEENTGKMVATTAYRFVVKNSYEERLEKRINKQHKTFKGVFTVGDLREMFE